MKVQEIEELDPENREFYYAAKLVTETWENVYLTGKAGSGKTTFLHYIQEKSSKNTVVLAPTGVAAVKAGGMTVHSFFQLPVSPFLPDDKRLRHNNRNDPNDKTTIFTTFKYNKKKQKLLAELELLIIDEVSMLRVDILQAIDKILQCFKGRKAPFGGVQTVLIGDAFQLPPVLNDEQWGLIRRFYRGAFFFRADAFRAGNFSMVELKKIYRQKDREFIDLLNRVRINAVTPADIQKLNERIRPAEVGKDGLMLTTHNQTATQINELKMNELQGKSFVFRGEIVDDFPEKNCPVPLRLELKIGAQIMFIRNDANFPKKYFNGKIGTVCKIENGCVFVESEDPESEHFAVEPITWESVRYDYNSEHKRIESKVVGTFTQLPIKPAWAVTVHKSQGLTLDKVILDLNRAFARGQVYVALSRCTSFEGISLSSPILRSSISTDPEVAEFARQNMSLEQLQRNLEAGRADWLYRKAYQAFKTGNTDDFWPLFDRAVSLRDDRMSGKFRRLANVLMKKYRHYQQLAAKIELPPKDENTDSTI